VTRNATSTGAGIQLEKWYFDLTTPAGEVFIGYWARIRVFGASMTWSRWSLSDGSGEVDSRTSMRPGEPPAKTQSAGTETTGKPIIWRHDGLGIEGEWRTDSAAYREVLLERPRDSLEWVCLCPGGSAQLRLRERRIAGVGYVEMLRGSLRPWGLPIRELHWGRFIAGEANLVWIRWIGPHPLSLAVSGGSRVPVNRIDSDTVSTQDFTLRLEKVRGLDEAHLGAAVRASLRPVRWVIPGSVFPASERKWLSRGVLQGQPLQASESPEGWAVHERIRFGGGQQR
jgi:hypothetical protein